MYTPKMYVLVRKDLAETYRCVQGAHALAQYALKRTGVFRVWDNQTIVFLGIRNLKQLNDYANKLEQLGLGFEIFCEPDLDDQFTALAYYGEGEIFKDLKTV